METTSATFVLDSNQYIQDFSADGVAFRKLKRYLRNTDSTLLMPEVVWEEVASKYVSRRQEAEADLAGKIQELRRLAAASRDIVEDLNVAYGGHSILDTRSRFCATLKERLALDRRHFIGVDNHMLERAWQRCLAKQPPLKKSGDSGFKDAVLWESILALSTKHESYRQGPVVFISANTTDFAETVSSDGSQLRAELVAEATAAGLSVEFYPSISRFFKDHQTFDDLLAGSVDKHRAALKGFKSKLREFLREYFLSDPAASSLVARSLGIEEGSRVIVLSVVVENVSGTVEHTDNKHALWSLLATVRVGFALSRIQVQGIDISAPHLSSEWDITAKGKSACDGTAAEITELSSKYLLRAYAA